MSRKILFFINPISGTKSKLQLEKTIIRKCEEKNISFEILFTSKDGDYRFLHDKINNENVTDIAIAGGDGSLSPIISSVLNRPVNIGIIPLGSGNGLARTAGIPNSVDKAFDTIFTGKSKCTDVFLINDKLSVHVSGLGFDAKVAHDFSEGKSRGLNAYTKIAVNNFLSAKTYPFMIEVDEKKINVDAFFICIANSNQFGNNFKVAPKASICDGLLDIVVLPKTNKATAVLSFAQQIISGSVHHFSAAELQKKNVLYFQTRKLKIDNPALAPLHIDGDPSETSKEFSIEILPSAYKLIQP
jgi:YegS/Rv2252/BmrU family lipid kinase